MNDDLKSVRLLISRGALADRRGILGLLVALPAMLAFLFFGPGPADAKQGKNKGKGKGKGKGKEGMGEE